MSIHNLVQNYRKRVIELKLSWPAKAQNNFFYSENYKHIENQIPYSPTSGYDVDLFRAVAFLDLDFFVDMPISARQSTIMIEVFLSKLARNMVSRSSVYVDILATYFNSPINDLIDKRFSTWIDKNWFGCKTESHTCEFNFRRVCLLPIKVYNHYIYFDHLDSDVNFSSLNEREYCKHLLLSLAGVSNYKAFDKFSSKEICSLLKLSNMS